MIIVGRELEALVLSGAMQAPMGAIQASHIDVTLDNFCNTETDINAFFKAMETPLKSLTTVDLAAKETVAYTEHALPVRLEPNEFALFALREKVSLPLDVTAEFYLDSGPARSCVEHSCATLLLPGWSGYLTLEIKNVSRYHALKFSTGMPIGKIVFYRHGMTKGYTGRFQDQEGIKA